MTTRLVFALKAENVELRRLVKRARVTIGISDKQDLLKELEKLKKRDLYWCKGGTGQLNIPRKLDNMRRASEMDGPDVQRAYALCAKLSVLSREVGEVAEMRENREADLMLINLDYERRKRDVDRDLCSTLRAIELGAGDKLERWRAREARRAEHKKVDGFFQSAFPRAEIEAQHELVRF